MGRHERTKALTPVFLVAILTGWCVWSSSNEMTAIMSGVMFSHRRSSDLVALVGTARNISMPDTDKHSDIITFTAVISNATHSEHSDVVSIMESKHMANDTVLSETKHLVSSRESIEQSKEEDADYFETKRRSLVEDCQFQLQEPVSKIQKICSFVKPSTGSCMRKPPLLQSMVQVDGSYRLVFITEHMVRTEHYARWTTGANWTCDDQPATLYDNQHMNDAGTGGTFVLTCPLGVQRVAGRARPPTAANDKEVVEYNTSLWRQCSDANLELGLPTHSTSKVACTMLAGDHWELTQWIEYHRMIGFERFLIYLNERYNATDLPDAADITYIPWNYTKLGQNNIPLQAAQQQDCILRAQARNVTWLALFDVDEYLQIMNESSTLDEILLAYSGNQEMGGLQLPSWFRGDNLMENRTALDATQLVIDSVWRGPKAYGDGRPQAGREKMIIRPRRVFYFGCHKIVLGGPMLREPQIRMNHYKERDKGVFWPIDPKKIISDESFRNRFGPKLRQRLGLLDETAT